MGTLPSQGGDPRRGPRALRPAAAPPRPLPERAALLTGARAGGCRGRPATGSRRLRPLRRRATLAPPSCSGASTPTAPASADAAAAAAATPPPAGPAEAGGGAGRGGAGRAAAAVRGATARGSGAQDAAARGAAARGSGGAQRSGPQCVLALRSRSCKKGAGSLRATDFETSSSD